MKTRHIIYCILLLYSVLITYSFAQDNDHTDLSENVITRLGKGRINVMQFSPDGKRLAVGTSIGLWLYNVQDGKEPPLFTEDYGGIITLAFSPDGKMLAAGSFTHHTIQIWDINASNIKPGLTLHDRFGDISSLEFAKDNKTLHSLSKFGYHTVWDVITGKETSAMRFSESISVLAFARYGTTFAVGDPKNNQISLWDSVNRDLGEVFKKQSTEIFHTPPSMTNTNIRNNKIIQEGVEEIVFSPDSKFIASSHDDNIVRLWNTTNRTQRFSLKGHSELINTIAFSSDSNTIASGSADNSIMIWDVDSGHHLATLSGHKNNIKTLAFSPTETTLLVSGSADGTVRFWNTNIGKERAIYTTGHIESVEAVAFSSNNKLLCSAASNGTVQIWNVQTGEELPSTTLPHYDTIKALALSQDATLYGCYGANTIVQSEGQTLTIRLNSLKETQLWSLPIGEKLNTFQEEFSALAFSPDNRTFAAVTPFETVEIWNINSGKRQHSFEIEHSFTYKLVFSNNGKYLAKIDRNHRKTHLWDITTRQEIDTTFKEDFWTFAFSPDSTTIATQVSSGIYFWRITSTGLVKQKKIQSIQGYCSELIYSPDGNYLLRAHRSKGLGVIMILDVDSGIVIGNISGNMLEVKSLVFSHNGKILASVSEDGTILLWDWEKIMMKVGKQ